MNAAEVKEFLSHAKSMDEWNLYVENIKRKEGGKLPDFWQDEIIDSGFAEGQRLSFDSQLQHASVKD